MKSLDESFVRGVVVVVGDCLGLDQMRLEELVAPSMAHRESPTHRRKNEHRNQNRNGDREEGEELVEIQVHR